ncbi:MAG: glycosyltransferase, partial [Nitrospinaceae bacterium]
MNRPQERVFQSSTMTIKAPVTYIPAEDIANPVRIAVLHLLILMRRPIAYLKTLWFTWRRPEANRFREFVQAVSLTHILNRTGVIHLHTHYASEPAGVAEMVRKLRGTPFSISTHAKDIYLSPPETLRRKISHSRFVVTCTEHNRQYLSSIAAGDTPIARIYHGLVVDKFNPRSEDLYGQPGDRPPMILSVGRFRKKKGFPTLIQACRQLRDDGINFQCSIVGYGPEQESMEQLIEALRLGGRIHLLGKLVHEELTGLYRKADMFVLPC